MRKLPFLNGSRAFEAAARTGSFSAAAQELGVTASAVSRMVRLLEDRLDVRLFEREANRLVATPAGLQFQRGLGRIFDDLESLTNEVRSLAGSGTLTVGVGPTFAIRWLIPRLAAFRCQAPSVDVRITTGGAAAPFRDDWTCGITLGDGAWPGLVAEPLFAADLLPVCAPRVAEPLRAPDDLRNASLLRVRHAPGDWTRWLATAGVPDIPVTGPEFEFYGQALQAAADGVGVAMGIRPYVDDDLAAGRLVAPFSRSIDHGMRWYFVYREARLREPALQAFRAWVTDAAAMSKPQVVGSRPPGC